MTTHTQATVRASRLRDWLGSPDRIRESVLGFLSNEFLRLDERLTSMPQGDLELFGNVIRQRQLAIASVIGILSSIHPVEPLAKFPPHQDVVEACARLGQPKTIRTVGGWSRGEFPPTATLAHDIALDLGIDPGQFVALLAERARKFAKRGGR